MSNVLITGGAGFIGSHLTRHCLARGDTVHVLVRPQTKLSRLEGIAGQLHVHSLSLTDRGAVAELMAKAEPRSIFHLAARTRRLAAADLSDASASIEEDLLGLIVLLSCAATAAVPPRVFIRTGSLAEYGPGPAPARESQREQPLNAYAAALVSATHYLQMLRSRLPFPALTARLALIYGPQQDEGFFVPQLIRRCLARQTAEVLHPSDRRDMLYVTDLCEALMRMAERPPELGLINVSTGEAPSMRDLALRIAREAGADPASIMFGPDQGTGGIPDFRASPALLHGIMDWRPRVSLSEGIVSSVAWYRQQLKEAK